MTRQQKLDRLMMADSAGVVSFEEILQTLKKHGWYSNDPTQHEAALDKTIEELCPYDNTTPSLQLSGSSC